MRKLLIRLFIRDGGDPHAPAVRAAYGKLSGLVGIACNALLFLAKLVAGLLTGSVSITADAVNNLSDASSSVISLLGFKLAGKPADAEHPYGHGRYEYLSGLMVALLILVIGVELLKSSLDKVLHPAPVEFSWLATGILLLSILLKLWMMCFNRAVGRQIGSQALLATAADSRNDVISTTAVLAASLLSHYSRLELDGWMGLAVALFILYSGFGLVREAMSPLLGRAPDPQFVAAIRDKILSYPGVLGTHDLMIHDYGPGRQFASVHVEMAAEDDVLANHDVIDNIEQDFLRDMGLHIIVHLDPIATRDGITGDLRQWLAEQVRQIDPGLTIHDLRIVPGVTHTNVIFDCVVPDGLNMSDAALKQALGRLLTERDPHYRCVVTLDKSYAPLPHQAP